jgi:hemerythrin-like metal-binding protein
MKNYRCQLKHAPFPLLAKQISHTLGLEDVSMKLKQIPTLDIPQIDEAHHEIVELIRKLQNNIADDMGWIEIYSILIEIESKVEVHFTVEENLMKIHKYPGHLKHSEEHTEYLLLIREARERAVNKSLHSSLTDCLLEWWGPHTAKSDRGYADWFAASGLNLTNSCKTLSEENVFGAGI